jgi:hypothetical protein
MSLQPSTRLGPYEIISPIGAGGMGEVYRARDTRLDRIVAIKVLPEHLSSNPQLRERLEREARAISSLNHPHICGIPGRQTTPLTVEGTILGTLRYMAGAVGRRRSRRPHRHLRAWRRDVRDGDRAEGIHRKESGESDLGHHERGAAGDLDTAAASPSRPGPRCADVSGRGTRGAPANGA